MQRYFTLEYVQGSNKKGGRYKGDTPMAVAKNIAQKLGITTQFCIRETTKDSKKMSYQYKVITKNGIIKINSMKTKKRIGGGYFPEIFRLKKMQIVPNPKDPTKNMVIYRYLKFDTTNPYQKGSIFNGQKVQFIANKSEASFFRFMDYDDRRSLYDSQYKIYVYDILSALKNRKLYVEYDINLQTYVLNNKHIIRDEEEFAITELEGDVKFRLGNKISGDLFIAEPATQVEIARMKNEAQQFLHDPKNQHLFIPKSMGDR